jgi:hypothetical protein
MKTEFTDLSRQFEQEIKQAVEGVNQHHVITRVESIQGGVSGAILAVVTLKDNFSPDFSFNRIVGKFLKGVGQRERVGSAKLAQYFNCDVKVVRFAEIEHPHLHLSQYISGQTVHDVVRANNTQAWESLRRVTIANRDLWLATLSTNPGADVHGNYLGKLDRTTENFLKTTIPLENGSEALLGDYAGMPLVLNGRTLPNLNKLLAIMEEFIRGSKHFSLQHGDEGLGNYIIQPEKNSIAVVDTEKTGTRPVCEGMAKLLCWFPATISSPDYFRARITAGELRIEGRPSVPVHVAELNKQVVELLQESDLSKIFLPARLRAYCACYFIRELQWLMRRSREYMKPYIIEMALHQLAMMVHEEEV